MAEVIVAVWALEWAVASVKESDVAWAPVLAVALVEELAVA